MLSNLESKEMSYTMEIKCAWCGLDMGTKSCNAELQDKISHGICQICKKKLEEEIHEL